MLHDFGDVEAYVAVGFLLVKDVLKELSAIWASVGPFPLMARKEVLFQFAARVGSDRYVQDLACVLKRSGAGMHLLHPRLFPKVAFVVYLNFNGVGLTVAIDLGALDEQKGFVLEDDATALVVVLVIGKFGRSRTAGPHHLLEAGVLELAGGCVGLCVERHLPWLIGDPVT